jgi:hypothetical protein
MINELQERLKTLKGRISRAKTLSQKKSIADDLHSLYTRLRDSFDGVYGKCITCNKIGQVKYMDNGHFMDRQHMATRWEEKNTNLQCKYKCNKWGQGEQAKHHIAINKKYGEGTAELLILKHKNPTKVRIACEWAIGYYLDKLEKMNNDR